MMSWRSFAVVWLALSALACTSGGDSNQCDTSDGAPLADLERNAWPKYRRDHANTGHIERGAFDLADNPAQTRWVFPPSGALGPLESSPIIGTDGTADQVYFFGRGTDGSPQLRLYVVSHDGEATAHSVDPELITTLTSTPLVSENGRIVVALADGTVRQYDANGRQVSAAVVGGFISASPNIDVEGTVQVASGIGIFSSVCANGGFRFAIGTGATQSSPAVFQGADPDEIADDLIVLASGDARVRAVDFRAQQQWQFVASAPIQASVVLDPATDRAYVADTAGRVFAVRLSDGLLCSDFRFSAGARITASPALAAATLYVADEDGTVYALRLDGLTGETCATGTPSDDVVRWSYNAGAPIRSSPAVATGGDQPVLVFGADDGLVRALGDAGAAAEMLWTYRVDDGGAIGRSSPAIGNDGTVYIGSAGGHLYAIGSPAPATRTPTVTPTETPTVAATGTPTPTPTP